MRKVLYIAIAGLLVATITVTTGCNGSDRHTAAAVCNDSEQSNVDTMSGTATVEPIAPEQDKIPGDDNRQPEPISPDTVSGAGTVTLIDPEHDGYGILGDDGRQYEPINWAPASKLERLRVLFQARVRNDIPSEYSWGTPIEIITIKHLGWP